VKERKKEERSLGGSKKRFTKGIGLNHAPGGPRGEKKKKKEEREALFSFNEKNVFGGKDN